MPWQITLPAAHPIVETSYSGLLTKTDLIQAVNETLALARRSGRSLLLADCTALAAGGHSLADLYFLAESLRASELAPKLKEAVLLPVLPDAAELAKFWEIKGSNVGLQIRVFGDRADAIEWLLRKRSDSVPISVASPPAFRYPT